MLSSLGPVGFARIAFQHAPAFGLRLSARRLRRLVSTLLAGGSVCEVLTLWGRCWVRCYRRRRVPTRGRTRLGGEQSTGTCVRSRRHVLRLSGGRILRRTGQRGKALRPVSLPTR